MAASRLDLIARALGRACAEREVKLKRDEIPYGAKFTLVQGAAVGVIAAYASGKVVPNPKTKEHFADVLAALEPVVMGAVAARGRKSTAVGDHAAVTYPYAGSDESGKGDYFGPLAVAAVLVRDAREEELLKELGVRDSKEVLGTESPRRLAAEVREVCRGRFAEVTIAPERYNRMVAELKQEKKTLNDLLAWAHVKAHEPLVAQGATLAVADKFGNERSILGEMKKRGLKVKLRQETRGERYVAVAAASLLARDLCLAWFEKAEAEAGERIPRGAFDPGIIGVGRRMFQRGGDPELGRFAKLHFKTTARVRS